MPKDAFTSALQAASQPHSMAKNAIEWGTRLYPQGVLGWAKTAHSSINVDDRSLWWVPRLIGGFFVAGALMFVLFGFHR